jgi:hypothetical protein
LPQKINELAAPSTFERYALIVVGDLYEKHTRVVDDNYLGRLTTTMLAG